MADAYLFFFFFFAWSTQAIKICLLWLKEININGTKDFVLVLYFSGRNPRREGNLYPLAAASKQGIGPMF